MILSNHCSVILKDGVDSLEEILFWTGYKFFTNWTGLPAQRVFSGILEPAGTVEFGAISQPFSNWQPSITTVLNPMCT